MPNRIFDAAVVRTAQRSATATSDAIELLVGREEQRQPSLARIVEALRTGRCVDGYEAEQLQEHARAHGIYFDARQPEIPWPWLDTRGPLAAMQGGAGGGYLTGATVDTAVLDALRPYSVMLQSGVTIRSGLIEGNVAPIADADVQGYWLSQETTTIAESAPLIGAISMTPKNAGVLVRWSRQLAMQAPDLETFLRQLCARQIIQLVDTAAINGLGNNGQPLGLLNTAGIGTQSGTSLTWANCWAVRTALANANTVDANVAWLGHPGTRNVLAARERGAGDEYIWSDKDQITGRAANVSTVMPAATLIAGDFSQLVYAFFGSGVLIDMTDFNSASDFQSGISAMRLLVSVDTYLEHAATFVAITGIT